MGLFGGIIGSEIGRVGGRTLGEALGRKLGGKNGAEAGRNIGEKAGQAGGAMLGALAPFKTGGKVKGKKGMPVMIEAHGGEWVLPLNAKPTKKQKSIIQKNKRML